MAKPINNILVLGKTGVGKTSLINYLYDLQLPTGAGLPKTERGLHEVVQQGKAEYHIFDSWGIEADAMTEWQQKVFAIVRKRNKSPKIADWFHSVYYCFSANSGRIEAAEVDNVILPLLKEGCKVIIVLTNADDSLNKQQKLQGMRSYLLTRLQKEYPAFREQDIIPVSSIAGETFAGDVIKQFGKEQIIAAVERNLWEDIARRLPEIYRANVVDKMTAWRERNLVLVANGKISFFFNNESAKRLVDLINYDLQNTFSAIDADAAKFEKEISLYYMALMTGSSRELLEKYSVKNYSYLKTNIISGYDYNRGAVSFVFNFWGSLFRSTGKIRRELADKVDSLYNQVIASLDKTEEGYTGDLLKAFEDIKEALAAMWR